MLSNDGGFGISVAVNPTTRRAVKQCALITKSMERDGDVVQYLIWTKRRNNERIV